MQSCARAWRRCAIPPGRSRRGLRLAWKEPAAPEHWALAAFCLPSSGWRRKTVCQRHRALSGRGVDGDTGSAGTPLLRRTHADRPCRRMLRSRSAELLAACRHRAGWQRAEGRLAIVLDEAAFENAGAAPPGPLPAGGDRGTGEDRSAGAPDPRRDDRRVWRLRARAVDDGLPTAPLRTAPPEGARGAGWNCRGALDDFPFVPRQAASW